MTAPAERDVPSLGDALAATARRAPGSRAAFIGRQIQAAREESAARRERVLKHPDLAQRLTEQPLVFRRPQEWNGWVPPRALTEDTCEWCPPSERANRGETCPNPGHLAEANDSPRRAALVEICAEAMRREQEETPAAE